MGTNKLIRFMLVTALSLVFAGGHASADEDRPCRLTLPLQIFAVPEVEMNLYFANTVLTSPEQEVSFEVDCPLGKSDESHWTLTAQPLDVGSVPLTLQVKNADGAVIERASTTVTVVPQLAGAGKKIRLLIVGDSLTHASLYPNEIARLLEGPGNPEWKMLGTRKPAGAADRVVHEGYGGWTWAAFNSKFAADSTKPGSSSPFVFADNDGKPSLNVGRYFDERCQGDRPDFIIVKLGINDCFGFNADDAQQLDTQVDGVFAQAEKLLSEFRKAAPDAEIGVCLTTPGNSRDEAFVANYKDRYSRWGWKKIQHRLVERQLAHFGERNAEKIFLIPTELNLDVVNGYPNNNAVHPNAHGYQQIGKTIFAWIKWRQIEQSQKARF